jgi:hypothetical protein
VVCFLLSRTSNSVRFSFDSTIGFLADFSRISLKQLINKKLQQHNSHTQHTFSEEVYYFIVPDNDDECLVLLREGRRASAKRKRSVVQINRSNPAWSLAGH